MSLNMSPVAKPLICFLFLCSWFICGKDSFWRSTNSRWASDIPQILGRFGAFRAAYRRILVTSSRCLTRLLSPDALQIFWGIYLTAVRLRFEIQGTFTCRFGSSTMFELLDSIQVLEFIASLLAGIMLCGVKWMHWRLWIVVPCASVPCTPPCSVHLRLWLCSEACVIRLWT
jgi:hypothetical protein